MAVSQTESTGGEVEVDDQTVDLPPDTLVTEIERTRAELARTIDAITDRLNPANAARRTVSQAREKVSRIDPKIGIAGAAVAVGVVGLLVWRRLRK